MQTAPHRTLLTTTTARQDNNPSRNQVRRVVVNAAWRSPRGIDLSNAKHKSTKSSPESADDGDGAEKAEQNEGEDNVKNGDETEEVFKEPRLRKLIVGKKGKKEKKEKKDKKEKKKPAKKKSKANEQPEDNEKPMSLKEALLDPRKAKERKSKGPWEPLEIQTLYADDLKFTPVKVDIPPVPMLSYGLDRVLFNPGVYRLQDPRSRVFNFDPYLEKIMPANEFDFDALSDFKKPSDDPTLHAITKNEGTTITGSTSSMSGMLQHFHYLLSDFRTLNFNMLSREFPKASDQFSKITLGPAAVFLRHKDGTYAVDSDKSFDRPNIMSWLGHSLEKLLTTSQDEYERYRRSSPNKAPSEDDSSRCYHYSRQGNLLMRSQLDAYDPRLPGTGIFDLKTRAVVSIRMNIPKYEEGLGYHIRYARGEWESYEREFYDMARATMLKYSLQVRMGRMDGIYVAYHNIERIFGFQYLSISDLDAVLHGQSDTRLGDQEFRFSLALLDELLTKATTHFPNTSIRLHFETRSTKSRGPFMYCFAEPVTEEEADTIQSAGAAEQKDFARSVIGIGKNDPEAQAAWRNFQDDVDEQIEDDQQQSYPTGQERIQGASVNVMAERTEAADEAEVVAQTQVADNVESADETAVADDIEAEDKITVADEAEALGETTMVDEVEPPKEHTVTDEIGAVDVTTFPDEVEFLDEPTLADKVAAETGGVDETTFTDEVEFFDEPSLADKVAAEIASASPEEEPSGPLMGWVLGVRNKVNGLYVSRPEDLNDSDEWQVEYHIKEIPEHKRWRLYKGVKERRRTLFGADQEEADERLRPYRRLIEQYTQRGREWRLKEDEKHQSTQAELYKPLGPGSEAERAASTAETAGAEPQTDSKVEEEMETGTEEAAKEQAEETRQELETAKEESEKAKAQVVEGLPSVPS